MKKEEQMESHIFERIEERDGRRYKIFSRFDWHTGFIEDFWEEELPR